jgi:hypothetical protein
MKKNSWKKSGQEIRHCNVKKENKFFSELENTICKLNEVFGEQEEYHKSLEELITAYGTRRIHTKDSTAWINFRGCYYKNNGYHYCV